MSATAMKERKALGRDIRATNGKGAREFSREPFLEDYASNELAIKENIITRELGDVRDAVVTCQLASRRMFRLTQVPNVAFFGQLDELEAEAARAWLLIQDLKAKIQKAKGQQ